MNKPMQPNNTHAVGQGARADITYFSKADAQMSLVGFSKRPITDSHLLKNIFVIDPKFKLDIISLPHQHLSNSI